MNIILLNNWQVLSLILLTMTPFAQGYHQTNTDTVGVVHRSKPIQHHTDYTIPHSPVYHWDVISKTTETQCLAENIYFEGRGESRLGQLAIGLVTINRVIHPSFPNTICDVVFEKGNNRAGKLVAQFSWTLDEYPNQPNKRSNAWRTSLRVAQAMSAEGMLDNIMDFTHGATHYHTTNIDPKWTNLTTVMDIENHRFYTM